MEQPPASDALRRIGNRIEQWIPIEKERRAALELLAFAIENADNERDNAWNLGETTQGLALFTGRMLACRIGRGKIEMSVMGPISEEVLAALGAQPEENDAWKKVPGGVALSFPVERSET